MSDLTNAIWAALPIPAIIIDADDRIAEMNPAAEQLLNSSTKSFTGQPIWDKIQVAAPMEAAFERVRSGRAPLILNAVKVSTGIRKPESCDVQIAPIGEGTDHVMVLLETRKMAGKLDRAMSSQTAAKSAVGMAEMLAHEIKNPLAGITGAAQLISMSLTGEDLELTELIVEETRRVVKLLDQVEHFGNLSLPARVAVNLHDVLDRARKSAAVGFAAHMRIEEAYDPSLPLTWADPDQLLQVVQNLLKNAAEAGQAGGKITLRSFYEPGLSVQRRDGSSGAVPLQIEVTDDGPGLPPDISDQIFEPFVSGRENGTGLGLALVAKIVADHEGWIAVDSVPGRTHFRISLPVAPRDVDENIES